MKVHSTVTIMLSGIWSDSYFIKSLNYFLFYWLQINKQYLEDQDQFAANAIFI